MTVEVLEEATGAGPVRQPAPVGAPIDPSSPSGRRANGGVRPRRPALPRPPVPAGASSGIWALVTVAALCGWFLIQVLGLGGLEQARAQHVLYAELREQLAAQTAPTGGAIEPGAPVAILSIPTLGREQVVVEGTAAGDLLSGPGHRRDTVLPGQVGVSLVYGRALTYGGPFRSITALRPGDGIEVTTGQGEFVYRVDGVRRGGDPMPTALKAGGSRLTLVTAEGQGPMAAVAPTSAVYVDATLQGEAVIGPAGRPAAVPEAEKSLKGDFSVLPMLALALQALLLSAVGVVLVRRHLPMRVLWVLAAPVLIALAWWTTDVVVQLVPNLI
ncbi:class E sortase [Pengzhenrongella frigida]|uniref:Class E sortase n=1 Tax=Pengzhenrongella frigida TaxID=1259133 RepID=A0A4Q5MWK7_9MICO|nr:sortase [Cellulomonas sp. HLT2-17]RYV49988.1 class E sortase [Cellulomonas sp. HLT2-17]